MFDGKCQFTISMFGTPEAERTRYSRVPPERPQGTGLHWQVAQATSLINIVVEMSTAAGTAHQGDIIGLNPRMFCSFRSQVFGWRTEGWNSFSVSNPVDSLLMIGFSGGYMGDLVFNGGRATVSPIGFYR